MLQRATNTLAGQDRDYCQERFDCIVLKFEYEIELRVTIITAKEAKQFD
jgi:hypothetical protein